MTFISKGIGVSWWNRPPLFYKLCLFCSVGYLRVWLVHPDVVVNLLQSWRFPFFCLNVKYYFPGTFTLSLIFFWQIWSDQVNFTFCCCVSTRTCLKSKSNWPLFSWLLAASLRHTLAWRVGVLICNVQLGLIYSAGGWLYSNLECIFSNSLTVTSIL